MTTIRLHNTMTRRKEVFEPLQPGRVGMYLCGPTVYDRAHLGNARNVILFDVLFRLMRHEYGEDAVTYVRNFTDVDDKINARAAATGRSISDITAETTRWYHDDMDALGALRPTHEPRATDHIGGMIALIERLIARGHAYPVAGHVLFRVRSFPDYGRLSGRSVDDMIAGARVEVAPFKEDPMDFVLWKPSDPSVPGWESPWGRGRPGWHIECSAMSLALLGPAFDIHGGGLDLQFPHHENEIAQSRCAHPDAGFARYWLHNEMLLVEGRKMSKSLGNFFTVRDLLDQGVPGEVIRYVFLMTHYRSPMDWTEGKAAEAISLLKKWRSALTGQQASEPHARITAALSDDLNTPLAIAELHGLFARWQALRSGTVDDLEEFQGERDAQLVEVERVFLASANLLGILSAEGGSWTGTSELESDGQMLFGIRVPRIGSRAPLSAEVRHEINELLRLRGVAKALKEFERADKIRDQLNSAGISVKDDPRNNAVEWEVVTGAISLDSKLLSVWNTDHWDALSRAADSRERT